MKTEIFIACSGGVIQGVRATKLPHASDGYECYVVDYDDCDDDNSAGHGSEEDFERERLGGRTWKEIENLSVEVF